MTKKVRNFLIIFPAVIILMLTACGGSPKFNADPTPQSTSEAQTNTPQTDSPSSRQESSNETGTDIQEAPDTQEAPGAVSSIDYEKIKPNESGKIMVVMFHNFVPEYKSGDKYYTTTFKAFRDLLGDLYDRGYRLISMADYLNNDIDVPAGFIPIIFTFDDGTSGQFNLVENSGVLEANPDSAVGIMEEFNRTHPDFGLKGTFYVNLGNNTFAGKGTVAERLKYLIDRGFEIGNHTYSHVNLKKITSAEKIQEEIGGNVKKMTELILGYEMTTFSLPYGLPSKELTTYVEKGQYQGISYHNRAIMEVGWDPAHSPVSIKFNPLSIHRVRASGIIPVEADLAWWLEKLKKDEQYISDGDPDTISVPKVKEELIDKTRTAGKRLVIY